LERSEPEGDEHPTIPGPAKCTNAVERSSAWLSRYRRLNTQFEHSQDHLMAFVTIALISTLARRLTRAEDLSARRLRTEI
jgi:transposase